MSAMLVPFHLTVDWIKFLEPMQCFLGDPNSGMSNLETHRLALAIAKKTLDEEQIHNSPKDHDKG